MIFLVITISNFILRRGFALSQTVTQPHCVIKQESPAITLRWARDNSACMKAPSEEIYSKSTQRTQ